MGSKRYAHLKRISQRDRKRSPQVSGMVRCFCPDFIELGVDSLKNQVSIGLRLF